MSAAVETRRPVLENHLANLLSRQEGGWGLSVAEYEALAEASFRLAVHPETESAAAFEHLYRAQRLDASNPSYAYHLGRLFLVHGEFEHAADWLVRALHLAPTSHRIWAHLSIVQRALNEKHRGDPRYEPDALRKRADAIAGAVRSGEDQLDASLADIVPPPSRASLEEQARRGGTTQMDEHDATAGRPLADDGVGRLLRAGTCRWSGIHDLAIEAQFRAPTSPRMRDQLLPQFEQVAPLALRRKGGTAAFAVLAIQWLVCGYPVATVRRLRATLPAAGDAGLALLDLTCELMEADEDALGQLLGEHLDHDRLPATLAALIHQRRLLWRPLAFNDRGAHRAARAFVADEREADERAGEARAHVKALEKALRAFDPGPSRPMGEPERTAEPDELGPTDASGRLADLERTAEALGELRTELHGFVKGELAPAAKAIEDASGCARVGVDRECAQQVLDGLRQSATDAGADVERLKAGIAHLSSADLEDGFADRLDTCHKNLAALTGLGNIAKALRKVDAPLTAAREQFGDETQPPSPAVARLAEALAGLRMDAPAPRAPVAPRAAARPLADEAVDGVDEDDDPVRAILARVDRAVDRRFVHAHATFAHYGPKSASSAPIRALRDHVRACQADALYRLDRRDDAQRVWYEQVAADRLNVAALKNLAVSHTYRDEIAQATRAWEAYVQALYFLDVAGGSARPHAQARSAAHRTWAAAYGPRSLAADAKKDVDLGDVAEFLASAGRVKAFSAHRRLAALNTAMAFHSPALVLGVNRATYFSTMHAGYTRLLGLIDAACEWLPEWLREPFSDRCRGEADAAYEAASEVRHRTLRRDRHYTHEEELHVAALKESVLLKRRVRNALGEDTAWALSEQSGDIVGNLRFLDAIELDASDELAKSALSSLGIDDQESLDELNDLSGFATRMALYRLFKEPSERLRERYAGIAESWLHSGVEGRYLDVLDDPWLYYPDGVKAAFKVQFDKDGKARREDRRLVDEALAELTRWSARMPGATGPARLRAGLLTRMNRGADARELVESALEGAFHPSARVLCAEVLVLADVADGEFRSAHGAMRELLETRAGEVNDLELLRMLFIRWLNEGSPNRSLSPQNVRKDFDAWIAGAREAGVDEAAVVNAIEYRREVLAHATIGICRNARGKIDSSSAARAMYDLRQEDPGNVDALYLQMQYSFGYCVELHNILVNMGTLSPGGKLQREQVLQQAQHVHGLTQELLAATTRDDTRRNEAHRIQTQLQRIRV